MTSWYSCKLSRILLIVSLLIISFACMTEVGAPAPTQAPASTAFPTQAPAVTAPPSSSTSMATGTGGVTLPEFPWPPPKASAWTTLTLGSIGKKAGAGATFGDVDSRISTALQQEGYERSYFSVPDGFAIVTNLEQINSDGSPKQSDRWLATLTPMKLSDFSLSDYLAYLIGAPQGYYRVFVFIVTTNVIVPSGTQVSQETAESWTIQGANEMPDAMKKLPFTTQHSCTVYVYEFIQSGIGGQVNLNIPSIISAQQHLVNAKLWDELEK